MKKLIIPLIIAIIAVAVLLIFKPFGKSTKTADEATKISTAVVKYGDLTITVNSTGIVEPILTVELKSKASGEIIELPIDEGDKVTKGQLIARLDATTAQNDFDQAEADLRVAEKSLTQAIKEAERQQQLFDQKLISELEYENGLLARETANSNLVRARTNLDNARERLSQTVIKSPIDGIVLLKNVEKGQIIASGISAVSGGTTIATLADMTKAYIRASVDEVDIGQINVGQDATVIAESYPDREFKGQVLRIHPQAKVQQNVTTFDVTTVVDNSDGLLKAGMNANVEIIAGHKENILLVPREALTDARTMMKMAAGAGEGKSGNRSGQAMARTSEQQIVVRGGPGAGSGSSPMARKAENSQSPNPSKMVIVVNNGEQEPRQIEIGLSNFEEAEIVSGLTDGDTVLTTITSKALKAREEFLERMKGWNQLPGLEKKR